jgi:hypothetical protein
MRSHIRACFLFSGALADNNNLEALRRVWPVRRLFKFLVQDDALTLGLKMTPLAISTVAWDEGGGRVGQRCVPILLLGPLGVPLDSLDFSRG